MDMENNHVFGKIAYQTQKKADFFDNPL